MTLFQLIAIVIALAALFSFVNYRLIKLPTTIGVMVVALLASIALIVAGRYRPDAVEVASHMLQQIDFDATLLHGLLAFLLFAGALKVDLSDLASQKTPVAALATVGVLVSTAIVGGLTWLLFHGLGQPVSLTYCLLFGALISPTDPVAVLAIVKRAGAPRSLEIKIAGESLFNDGIGVVVFLSILEFAHSSKEITVSHVVSLLAMEAAGGVAAGLVLGTIAYQLLKRVNDYHVEILLTLALAVGGYSLAEAIHTSAPIAIVVAGLLIGNHGRAMAMSAETRAHLDNFWELIDEILNVVLFTLIGLEVLVIPHETSHLVAGGMAIVIVLLARWASVAGTVGMLRRFRPFSHGAITILTWSGLRGGISVALALSLPGRVSSSERETIIAITYAVVVFSIIVQGLTIGPLIRSFNAARPSTPDPATDLAAADLQG